MLHREMVTALLHDDRERAKEARNRFHEVVDDPVQSAKADALFDALVFDKSGDPKLFKNLRDRAADSRITAYVEYLTGMVLENVKRPAEAANAYRRASEAAKRPEFRAELIGMRAKMLIEIRQADMAEQEVKMALRAETDPAAKAELWKALARTYEAREQFFDQAIVLQEVREHEPNSSDLCFSIAWALSQSEQSDVRGLAIHFYRLAIYLDSKNQYALNNLGWEYSKAGLQIKAAEYYVRAADLGNTLAMANLAGMKLTAGLADEADELLKKAQEQESVHENVAGAQARSSQARSEQDSKADSLDKSGAQLAEFCSKSVHAELRDGPVDLPERWRWAKGESVVMDLGEARLTCEWLEGGTKHKLEADIRGRSGRGEVLVMGSRFSIVKGEQVETKWEAKKSAMLIIDDSDAVIQLAFTNEDGTEFRRLQADEAAPN